MSYQPPIPPKVSPTPRRRPTYGSYPDNFDDPPPAPDYPRRRPVGQPPRPSPTDNSGSRVPHRQASYGSPPVDGGGRPSNYEWPKAAQSTASGYTDQKSTLVYPEDVLNEPAPPLPPPPPPRLPLQGQRKSSRTGNGYPSPTYDSYGQDMNTVAHGVGDMMMDGRPLPPRPLPQNPYPPTLQISPWEEQYPSYSATYPNDRYHSPEQDYRDDPFKDPFDQSSVRRSPSSHNVPQYVDMPSPAMDLSQDILHPLPATPKSPSYVNLHSPEMRPPVGRHGSNNRPGTRSSTSSVFSYTQDRPIENDYYDDHDNDYTTSSPTSYRSDSLGRTGTILSVQRNPSYGILKVDTADLTPPPVPPPPPSVKLTEPTSPPRHGHSNSFSTSPPIYRSRTEPGHYRSSSTEPIAPTPPPKVPLTENHSRPASLGVLRSQSQGSVKPLPRSPSRPATKFEKDTSATLMPPDDSPLSPVTESKTFPLSSKTFQLCTEPWSLSALRNWVQEVFGSSVSMETVSLALQGLFTHHVSTLSVQQADKLAAQVGTTWVREGVLFEPTVANTALWNPLSTLEMGFTPFEVQGVLPTLTGKGCYSPSCASSPPGRRCYSHLCSRTLIKKSGLPPPPPIVPGTTANKAADWVSFWELDDEFLRALDKREIKRQNVIFEFIQNEEEYVSDLNTMLNLFQKQIISASSTPMPIVPSRRVDQFLKRVFGNVKPILDWQMKTLLVPLRERQAQQGPVVRGVGDIVIDWVKGCRDFYSDYAGGYPSADLLVREETTANPTFASWLDVLPVWSKLM